MTEFLIGADPEFFVKKDGKHVSAYNLIPGTKAEPYKVKGGAVQVDGMALEFNIDPASSFAEFDNNITTVLGELRKMVGPEYEFDFSPVAHFGKEYIDAQPEKARELGCDPDYSAYTGVANPSPDGGLGIRTASGHIHIGWTNDQDIADPNHIEACRMLTKQLDHSIGLASGIWDEDPTRREMYGQFGAYRPKPYGVEYRVMSNKWVNDPALRRIVYHMTIASAKELLAGRQYYNGNPAAVTNVSWDYSALADNIDYGFADLLNRQFREEDSNGYRIETRFMSRTLKNIITANRKLNKSRPVYADWRSKYSSREYIFNRFTMKAIHKNDIDIDTINANDYVDYWNIINTLQAAALAVNIPEGAPQWEQRVILDRAAPLNLDEMIRVAHNRQVRPVRRPAALAQLADIIDVEEL